MRPGPGLVVMALAFISGARRGSTSTSSKTTTLSPTFTSSFYASSSSPSSLSSSSSSYTSSWSSNSRVSSTLSLVFAGGGIPTPTASTASSSDHNYNYDTRQPQSEHLRPAGTELLTQTGSSSRATRGTRSAARNYKISAPVGGGDDNYNEDNSRSSDSSGLGPAEGLAVQFPSHSADSSASFDEDDILALVSEDDLLSQESLDRLTKLTNDKIGYINEEDYGGLEFGEVVGDEDSTSDLTPQKLQPPDEVREHGIVRGGGEEQDFGIVDGYVANLVSSNVAAFADSATESAQQDLKDAATLNFKELGLDSPVFDSRSALTRINPWLSACDLAQPGTAPDLQGQCTAGTLPVAWVDEGPGPPTCPKSCQQLRLENNKNTFNSNNNNNNYNNNKKTNDSKYIIDENSVNIKLNQPVNNNNNNNNNNMNTLSQEMLMLKVRRDVSEENNSNSSNTNNNGDIKKTPTTEVEALQHDDANFVASDSVQVVDDTTMTGHHHYRSSNANSNNNNNNHNKQSQNNNNIVKLNANHVSSSHYDLKYNSNNNNNNKNNNLNQEPSSRSGGNNNYNQFKQQQQQQHASDKNAQHTQLKQQKIQQEQHQQQEQQQCLDYLGDNDESSPLHLCQLKDPSALAYKLRSLRLRHCCERNVFSALHTIALNATMSGGAKCVRVLTDIMELDSLATRITCELAEILFRFDCRQVYSLIHQCTDCKEAYRRWVCSTLIPYFAEQNETIARNASNSNNSNSSNTNTNNSNSNNNNNNNNNNNSAATTSNSTNSNKQLNNQAENNNNNNNNRNKNLLINNNDIENLYKIENNNNLIKSNKNIHSNNNHNNNNQADFNKNNIIKYFNNNVNKRSERSERSEYNVRRTERSTAANFHEVIDCYINSRSGESSNNGNNNNNNSSNISSSKRNINASARSERVAERRCVGKTHSKPDERGHLLQQQHGAHNPISTATNEDPCAEDPVISKLLKRSKRKVEFRKRRRIRPCLSVCQTVEQKCPYLLPADRAPAVPTQYAGEPTFLCLDPVIEETGEQRLKSNNGPAECCYQYCGRATQGLCTYCSAFAVTSSDDLHDAGDTINSTTTTTTNNSTAGRTTSAPTRHVHNITLSSGTSSATQQRMGSVSIALLNVSSVTGVEEAERLPYYAYYAGTFYYDDIDEMPHEPLPECQPVPSVSSRCTIPYYASAAAATAGRTRLSASSSMMRALMLCLSALFCLLNSGFAFAAVCRWDERRQCGALDSTDQRRRQIRRSSSSENGDSLH